MGRNRRWRDHGARRLRGDVMTAEKMRVHFCRAHYVYWDAIERGDKRFFVDEADKDFRPGDVLMITRVKPLRSGAWAPVLNEDGTTVFLNARIIYVECGTAGINDGCIIAAIEKMN